VKIIDSSSLGKYVNKEENWQEIAKHLVSEQCSTLEFAVLEVGNSVWKRVLRKEISKNGAMDVYKEFVRAVFEDGLVRLLSAESGLLDASLEFALEEKLTMYDSAFVQTAQRNKCELITSDEKQSDASKKHYPGIPVTYIR
jgi:predicted nucleic acid-binding protein